jgi:polysaccharide export outer membrane protein
LPYRCCLALRSSVKPSLVALALLAGLAGCGTSPTSTFPEIPAASAGAPPATPQEWLRQNFPTLATNPVPVAAQATNLPAARPAPTLNTTNRAEQLLLREGDTLRISFPGAPTLNTLQQVQRDGSITLPLIGEFKVAGLARAQVEKELLKLYDSELQVKEVTVALESAVFAVYVTGAVLRPGKILSDRPLSAMEAVIEAGLDHNKANLKKVRLIRLENGRTTSRVLNLKKALSDKPAEPFNLKPSDIIYVPERFPWF